jgi:REP element-mobilizing transposase RayT
MRQNSNVHHVWQRDYYEHIIRDELSYIRIARYIIDNPEKWKGDKFYNR